MKQIKKYGFLFLLSACYWQCSDAQTAGGEIAVYPHIKKQPITDWGYDIKQPGKAASLNAATITKVFVEDGMNVLRIPIYARDGHPSEGVVTDAAYTVDNDIIGAINRVKAVKPSVKIFASLRLEGPDTFLSWVEDGTGKVDSAQLAKLYRDYLVYMQGKGITIDVFGVDNEPEFNLGDITPAKYKNIVGRLRNYAEQGLFTIPAQFIGAETYGPGNATTFVNTLNSNGWGSSMDIGGTHYYPHLRPLTSLTNFTYAVGTKPKWNTEIHWDSDAAVNDDIEAEQGLISIFDCLDLGFTGMTWWSYGTGNNYRSQLNRALVQSAVNSQPIDADDVDGRLMTEVTKLNTRAFRTGNRISLWIINRRATAVTGQVVKLMSGTISGTPAYQQWINTSLSVNGNLTISSPQSATLDLPANSITLVTFDINEAVSLPYTTGNLLVVRSGYATNTLTDKAEAVLLDEYSSSGQLLQTRQLNPLQFTLSGNVLAEGFLTASPNGQYLALPGYEAQAGEKAVAGTTAAATKRVVALMDATGNVDYSTKLGTAFDGNFVTGAAVSSNGDKIWVAGNGNASTGGLYYIAKGGNAPVKINGTNLRVPAIFNNQLYISSNSGTLGSAVRLGTVGTGLPEATATATNLPGADFGLASGSGGVPVSIFQYALVSLGSASPNILYVTHDGATGPGIKKYMLESGSWNYKFTIGNGTDRYRGLTFRIAADNVLLYATADGNKLLAAVDVNAATNTATVPVATTLATAPANTLFRGLALTPGTAVVLPLRFVEFTAALHGKDALLQWKTADEINVERFVVERSGDGRTFFSIGSVQANNGVDNRYNSTDYNLPDGLWYYRLKQTDKDGKFSYSRIAKVYKSSRQSFVVFPSPAAHTLNVSHTKASANRRLTITTVEGRQLRHQVVPEGNTLSVVSLAGLPKGMYVITVGAEGNEESRLFEKL